MSSFWASRFMLIFQQRVYSIQVGCNFKFCYQVKLGAVLLKQNCIFWAKCCELGLLNFEPKGWWNWLGTLNWFNLNTNAFKTELYKFYVTLFYIELNINNTVVFNWFSALLAKSSGTWQKTSFLRPEVTIDQIFFTFSVKIFHSSSTPSETSSRCLRRSKSENRNIR